MPLNPARGDNYPFVDYTKNYIGGKCPHGCSYCYVDDFKKKYPILKERYSGEPRLIEKEFEEDLYRLGKGFIFIQNCGDLFAYSILKEWKIKVLGHCNKYPENKYLFQTKNPLGFHEFLNNFPPKTVLGTTIETNRFYKGITYAPFPMVRYIQMCQLPDKFEKMVSIEPIMDFDLDVMLKWIGKIKPSFVSIGADSKNNDLEEPSKEKVQMLINEISNVCKVIVKRNLERLR